MVLHNPNNWHWVNKDASGWAKQYFEDSLIGTSAESEGNSVEIKKVISVDGDVDVSQRKGKVIALFDVKLQLEYDGQTSSGGEVNGTITIPEVAHDTEPHEYVFEISNYADSSEKQPVRDLIRSDITPQLREKLSLFAKALMDEHGKDIQHTAENDPKLRSTPIRTTPTTSQQGSSSEVRGPTGAEAVAPKKAGTVSTTNITETFEFQTSADQLYLTFVDINRVAAFTRDRPRIFEPKVGGEFSLFGGNVEGSFLTLEEPIEIRQRWRLSNWPAGHFSELSLKFDQGLEGTSLRLNWTGVPVGQEDVTRRNFEEYYAKSIKVTFGFGMVL